MGDRHHEDEDAPAPLVYARSGTHIFGDANGNGGQQEDIAKAVDLEEMWAKYQAEPNFFKAIAIAKDGGFSEVDELVGVMRYVAGGLTLSFVALNIWSLISINLPIVFRDESKEQQPIFLITTYYITTSLGWDDAPGVQVAATIELLFIIAQILRILVNVYYILFPAHEMWKWHAVQELVWRVIPEAATMSTLKLLNYVTPAVLLPAISGALAKCSDSGAVDALASLSWLILSRIVFAWIGFDAFLFKLQTVEIAMKQYTQAVGGAKNLTAFAEASSLMLLAMAFLNQMLGIVQLNAFVRERIFSFIFAGEDGQLSANEEAVKETWESMLAKRIWTDLKWYQAIACYLSYSDADFQKLSLETVDQATGEKKNQSGNSLTTGETELAASS